MSLFDKRRKQEERKELIEQTKKTIKYTLNNIEKFNLIISKLVDETKNKISKIKTCQNSRLNFKEKNILKEQKSDVEANLNHLYLAKEYFVLINRINNELPVSDNQYIFINKFLPFFDGSKVLDIELEDEEYDSPLFDTYEIYVEELIESFEEKVENYIVPSFDDCITLQNKHLENLSCPQCNYLIDSKVKFCPECGYKIENIQNKYCSVCNTELSEGAKFCPECGTKVS